MRNKIIQRAVVAAATMTLAGSTALAADPDAITLVKKYDSIMGPAVFESESTMEAHREDGTTRAYKMKVLKSGNDKLRVYFSEPSSAKGQEMLRNGDNLWNYMPNLKRAMRIPSRDNFMGGDFNNADVLRANYEADYDPKVVPSQVPNTYALELTAKPNAGTEAAYDRILLWMTKDARMLPVKAEFYAKSGKMLRSAEFSDYKDFGGGLTRPAKIVMRNELAKQRFSVMTTHNMALKESLSNSKFVLDDLGRQ